MPTEPSASPDRWLAALAARVEDDEDLLAAIPDDEVDKLLAQERLRPEAIQAAIHRRLSKVPRRRRRRTGWAVAASAVLALGAVFAWGTLRTAPPADGREVLAYQPDLEALASVPAKGDGTLAAGATALLDAAQSGDRSDARDAAALLADVARADTAPEQRATSAFFAALAYGLAGDSTEARTWLRQVPEDSRYGDAARALR